MASDEARKLAEEITEALFVGKAIQFKSTWLDERVAVLLVPILAERDRLREELGLAYAARDPLVAERDAALKRAEEARDEHHRLGAWPNCPHCTKFFNDDMAAAARDEAQSARLREAREIIAALIAQYVPIGALERKRARAWLEGKDE